MNFRARSIAAATPVVSRRRITVTAGRPSIRAERARKSPKMCIRDRDGDLSGRAAYAVDARESDAGGDFFPLRRDVRALYAADMEGGAGDVGPHARRDRTILDKVTI